MKRLVLFLVMVLLVVAVSFAQQVQMTQVTTLAGDSVKNYQFRSVDYLPSGVIWLQAAPISALYKGDNYVFLSTDNGTTWVKRVVYTNAALGSPGISMITAKDANTAFVSLTTGEIFRTTNAGVKWDTVTSYSTPDLAFADGVKYVGQDSLVAYGDAADAQGVFVTRSVDAGKTWTRFTNFSNDSLKTDGIYAGSVTYGGAMEAYGKTAWLTLYNTANDPPSLLKTTDGGGTWSWFRVTLPSGPATNYSFLSLTFKDNNVGFAVSRRAYSTSTTNSNYLCKTTDGGRTWSDTISVEPGKGHADAKPMTVRAIRGTNTVIAVGFGISGSKAWISNDNGTSWSPLNPPSPSAASDLKNIAFGSATQGIMVGLQNVVKFSLVTAVEETRDGIPTGFALEQNYPNPFNPTTTISYSVPKTSFVELKVYDLLGRTVATLVNSEQAAGTHTVGFDAKGLSSGVYMYTMKAGDFTATKSLVLVK
ncbi:T9SS C-terminal target domain-containing protein [bacterium]|nr:MAG: T9SS C-terminal target domain-containing protein [bacterium]